jgi:hypothetical protein
MRSLKRSLFVMSTVAAVLVPSGAVQAQPPVGSTAASGGRADAVLAWNANASKAAVAACIAPFDNPLHESRLYAIVHIAIHDALNAIDRRSQPYAFRAHVSRAASPDAAVASAARHTLVPLLRQIPAPFPPTCGEAGVASVEADYATALAAIADGPVKTRGVDLGRAAAAAILTARAADGSDTPLVDPNYPQGTRPGEYRFTPGTPFVFGPHWAGVTPFVLRDNAQFRPDPPDPVSSRKYAADLNEVKRLGGDGVTTPSARTATQTEIALFWVENSPHQWNRIARTISAGRRLDMWANARLFGLLNMALADGYIGSFEAKYRINYWRPVTAIQNADTDGNPNTAADPTWTPLRTTPPVPEYDSGHSVEGGAATVVMRRFFGTDRVGFAACSLTLPAGDTCADTSPVVRRYVSFSQAANENGLSRILVGFHFRKAVDEGIGHGSRIGDRAVDRFMRPVHG